MTWLIEHMELALAIVGAIAAIVVAIDRLNNSTPDWDQKSGAAKAALYVLEALHVIKVELRSPLLKKPPGVDMGKM